MYRHFFKRLFDFVIALIILLCISPLFVIIIICLATTNRGKVFFVQQRLGENGKIFQIFKFKSMTDKVDENGILLPNEQRITPIGLFIRKTSIDELPQLINILINDMSLVGPRPLPVRHLEIYSEEQKKRLHVKPGITGWAQVNGRNQISWTKKFELDVWYVEHISFLFDVKILFMTIIKVFKSSGINSENKVGSEGFDGFN